MESVLDYHQRLRANRRWAGEEGDAYFQGESQVFVAYRAVEERLKEAEIQYALAGVLAMFQHGYRRFSTDVEFWIAPGDWLAIEIQFLGHGYSRIGSGTKVRCERTGVTVVFSLCDKLSASTEVIDDIPTVTLAALIESKLVLGRAPGRLSALGDVQEMIRQTSPTSSIPPYRQNISMSGATFARRHPAWNSKRPRNRRRASVDHKFQINLGGIIDLLSNHLYSGPEVFVRELMQNATDAITARQKLEKGFVGDIRMEIHQAKGKPPTVMMSDNGIGLTPEEVHTFLATIGLSSKRALEGESQTDFIGQFGIGILSCFVVSDAITVYSKSSKADTKAVEWKAKPDGTYTLKEIDRDLEPGTQVWLTAKAGCEEHFDPARVKELAKHYGGLLPFPIRISHGKVTQIINERGAPWREKYKNDRDRYKAYLDFGREIFESDFLDAIPLKSKAGGVEGLAYVLPYAVTLTSKRAHRVYLKNMLLSENIENLLPEWAFFVKAAVNANDLRPTASREAFYEDAKLQTARETLGECLRSYLIELAEKDTRKLDKIIGLHGMAIKSLATTDDEFYRLVMDWLVFETSQGEMTFGDYRKQHDTVRYVPTVDQFRQVSRVSQAHGEVVINGGYTYDSELLAKAEELLDMPTEIVDPTTMSQSFDDLGLNEQDAVADFLRAAETVLKPFRCEPDVKKYKPRELPALYTTNQEGRFFRSLEQSKEIANPLWSGVLDNLGKKDKPHATFAHICFNFDNPLVARLCSVKDRAILHRSIQMLYLQSLLLGHHPLSAKEMTLLNDGLLSLIEWGIGMKDGG